MDVIFGKPILLTFLTRPERHTGILGLWTQVLGGGLWTLDT